MCLAATTKLTSYTYTLGNAGNRTNVLELNSRNVGYGYDNDYRLTSQTLRDEMLRVKFKRDGALRTR